MTPRPVSEYAACQVNGAGVSHAAHRTPDGLRRTLCGIRPWSAQPLSDGGDFVAGHTGKECGTCVRVLNTRAARAQRAAADLVALGTEDLLTRASNAAGMHAEGTLTADPASGPDHWRAIETLFQRALVLHRPYSDDVFADQCGDCLAEYPCPSLLSMRPLAEQVLRDSE